MGPWWLTVNKLEGDLRALGEGVHTASLAHPHMTHTPALAVAEAELERARDCVRRLKPPRPEPGDQLLLRASQAVTRAEQAVEYARRLAEMASRRSRKRESS